MVGHELGHILSGHAVYRTMLLILIQLAARIAWMPIGYMGLRAIIWGLEEWFRKSELSCDRAGLLAGPGRGRGPAGADEAGGRPAAVGAQPGRVPRAGARVRRGARPAGQRSSSCCSCRATRTRSRSSGSPSSTGGRPTASTSGSSAATTRAATPTGTRRSPTRSRNAAKSYQDSWSRSEDPLAGILRGVAETGDAGQRRPVRPLRRQRHGNRGGNGEATTTASCLRAGARLRRNGALGGSPAARTGAYARLRGSPGRRGGLTSRSYPGPSLRRRASGWSGPSGRGSPWRRS